MPESTITQYRPAFISGFENEVVAFATADDLLAIPFVENFTTLPDFHRFSLWRDAQVYLMAECDDGYRWWVVGRIDGASPDLPTWEARYRDD